MKIALFTDTFAPQVNGVAKTLKRLAAYLEREQIRHQIYAPHFPGEDLFIDQIHRSISLPFFLYPECRITFPNMLKMHNQLGAFQPDLIHITTPFNLGLTGLHYGKKSDIPMVASYHTHFDQYLKYYRMEVLSDWIWRYFGWFYKQHFSKIFVPSNETKQYLQSKGFTNLQFWKRGVDCHFFHPHYETNDFKSRYGIKEPFVFLFVSRLAPEKNLDTLAQIIEMMPESIRHSSHWLIVGDGPMRLKLENQFADWVTFTGYLEGEELAKAYAAADLFVFPSATETFGNVVLESLASSTPVIGANGGSVKEIIEHGKTGFLCNPYEPSDYIEKIITLLDNPIMLKTMGMAGRQYALKQSWDTIFGQLLSDYEETIYSNRKEKLLA
ncbi:glycosyltransferase family 4 protein [Lederbergia citri]|uniref:Glycosyltransferase family 1 protein n=1 Tax=Lederbergia citri TaxID=2833580 RepID=A0A942THW3_9BACI|nr:glycosyltransferase family 1 protein [Lederbergia citri]MBS4196417.1 glycosyltransferase family 1 protein [Lederbergia citri]